MSSHLVVGRAVRVTVFFRAVLVHVVGRAVLVHVFVRAVPFHVASIALLDNVLVCRALLILKKLIEILLAHITGRASASILLVELCLYLYICSRAVLVHVAS